MIATSNLTLSFGPRVLFKDVNLKFLPGHCYGLIGANGAGKSTFLKILSGQLEATSGEVITDPKDRIAVLQQDQFAFDEFSVTETVIMGHQRLYDLMQERESLYSKPDFSDEDGVRAAELETEFADLNGYDAESEAATLLKGLGIDESFLERKMGELEAMQKVRVLLAQAMFGNPDILLLDEPTNQLDLKTIRWLEDYLMRFNNTLIVVSHDRHFLNNVCTHIVDIDFSQIRMYVGNYEFWYEASQLALQQRKNESKKREEKIKELEAFVRRFSANVAKARQATSRKKLIDKLTVDELPTSSRRFPYVGFAPERPCGKVVLRVQDLSANVDGEPVLSHFSLEVSQGDKIAFIGENDLVKTTLFEILAGEVEAGNGRYEWGTTITMSYFPKENSHYFDTDDNIIDWLRPFSPTEDSDTFIRGYLGRMLFSGEEALKPARVLSGGEKVRCMLARMMLSGANVLMLDEPTNHLDLEAITALNQGLIKFPEVLLFASHDYEFVSTIANRIIEITPGGVIDRVMPFEAYLEDIQVNQLRLQYYHEDHAFMI
ncbi:MAG: ATP-binding cassette domain-containing protein [Chloroflexi bacterium]|nr:ATP-binding cassette domain-containing protein [Chloroflexota bacterium]MBP7043854.1 ATP-binding cassette domain-containing protein [Chloroflexota bacterium]